MPRCLHSSVRQGLAVTPRSQSSAGHGAGGEMLAGVLPSPFKGHWPLALELPSKCLYENQ